MRGSGKFPQKLNLCRFNQKFIHDFREATRRIQIILFIRKIYGDSELPVGVQSLRSALNSTHNLFVWVCACVHFNGGREWKQKRISPKISPAKILDTNTLKTSNLLLNMRKGDEVTPQRNKKLKFTCWWSVRKLFIYLFIHYYENEFV